MNPITDTHYEKHLKTSGIDLSFAINSGLYSVDQTQARSLIGTGNSGLVFPYINEIGEVIGYRIRQDNPRMGNAQTPKYLTSKKSDAFIYFTAEELSNIQQSSLLVILEGEKKYLKFIQERTDPLYAAVAIAGCWMFRKKDQLNHELHPVLEKLILHKKEVIIIPDSDYFINHKVKSAYNRLAKTLFERKVSVSLVNLI